MGVRVAGGVVVPCLSPFPPFTAACQSVEGLSSSPIGHRNAKYPSSFPGYHPHNKLRPVDTLCCKLSVRRRLALVTLTSAASPGPEAVLTPAALLLSHRQRAQWYRGS